MTVMVEGGYTHSPVEAGCAARRAEPHGGDQEAEGVGKTWA